MAFADTVKFTAGSSGTSDFSDGTALTGFRSLSTGAVSGQTYSYRAFSADLSQWENGQGVYASGSPGTLARTTQYETSTGSKVSFSSAPVVILTPLKSDLDGLGINSQVAPGASGNVLASNGTTWQSSAPPTPGMTLLTSGSISAAANLSIVLTGYTGYRGIEFQLINFIPATDGTNLLMRVSTNAGSSYDSGSTDYKYAARTEQDNGSGTFVSTGTTSIGLGQNIGSGSGEGGSSTVRLMGQTNTAVKPRVLYDTTLYAADDHINRTAGAGLRNSVQDTDAVQFLFSSGNIASGTYAVYGFN